MNDDQLAGSLRWQMLDEILIAEVELAALPAELPLSCLSPAEAKHAESIPDSTERLHFVRRKTFQRLVVRQAAGLGGSLASVNLVHVRDQRPACPDDPGLCLSFSSSGGQAIAAAARHLTVGIDIERLRSVSGALRLAERFFTKAETEEMTACPQSEQSQAFLELWSAKEACLKAQGRGVVAGLETFAFTRAGRTLAFAKGSQPWAEQGWQIRPVGVSEGYLAMLATCSNA